MQWLKCRNCGHTFNSGFFRISVCPKCWKMSKQIGKVIKNIILFAVLIIGGLYILSLAAPVLRNKIITKALAAIDTTMLFSYSKDAYLESIISGRLDDRYWTIQGTERPYYASILPRARVETAEPLGVLPADVVVELRSAIRRGEHVWIPASFYSGEKFLHVFVLFPRDWEQAVTVFDWETRVTEIKTQYEKLIRENFELMEVKTEEEKAYKEKYNDYFKVRDIKSDDSYFYAPKDNKPEIDKAHFYFLNPNDINMVIMQTDKEWERPGFVLTKTEEAE